MTQFDSYKDEENNKDNTRTRVGLIVGFFVMIIAMRWLASKLNRRIMRIRSHFLSGVKRILLACIILALVFGLVLLILNMHAKKQEYDEHYIEDEEDKKDEAK